MNQKTVNKLITNLTSNPQSGEGRQPSKYFTLVDFILAQRESKVSDRDINVGLRQAFIKLNKLSKGLASNASYRLFNAMEWRAMKIASHGRKWVDGNREHGFHALYQLALKSPVRIAKPAAKKAKTTKAAKQTVSAK